MTPAIATRNAIRDLNDAFRTSGSSARGQWMLTCGIQAKGADFLSLAVKAVREFDGFTDDNDPYGEHDFGSFNLAGETLFWKIDYYDRTLSFGSEDPADPAVTRRVITIMLASEY
ncbi:DUF3768 domain-containing protein [Phenylobacterium sp.]|uniref:DUF3768 domain-containing protein n=1 Tax=Phenylobacterium sp. TaxID=1871053 RepID=UPI00271C6CB2|nr:DUF3768 domain-containing protein [Phenylobacterium sp.]MDO8381027.1 DUF3768 domain-containing protein [Phenylobacterium sp.]